MTDDEMAARGEEAIRELSQASDEIARLRTHLREENARAEAAVAEGARLQTELAAANDAVAAFEADAASLRSMLEDAEVRTRDAAARYRELAVRAEADVPDDLIAGDTIKAIDESIARARAITASVRSYIEAQAQAARVPAGAPQRSAPDLSAMTPEQKIRHGLAQRAGT